MPNTVPLSPSTRISEAYFTDFAEPLQGMADAMASGVCQLIGLGRTAVLDPQFPNNVLIDSDYDGSGALARNHVVRGQWLSKLLPVKVVGNGLAIQFFYYNMWKLGKGLKSNPDGTLPQILAKSLWSTLKSGLWKSVQRVLAVWGGERKKVE